MLKYLNNKKFDVFNFLRGLALLCVLGKHTACVIEPI